MPGYVASSEALAVKVVSVRNRNPARGLPRVNALVLLMDPGTGEPVAVMNGRYLTALRTGAASGVATDCLARADATVLGVIGGGRRHGADRGGGRGRHPAGPGARGGLRCALIEGDAAAMASRRSITMTTDDHAVREADVVCTGNLATPVLDGSVLGRGRMNGGVKRYGA
jgi:ornithine cyclodeaminase/alanine dehydrogenase-like protein (mu-crystallin family)